MMNKYDIVGGNILVIGDLHFSDKKDYGKHKNYLENCFDVLNQLDTIISEQKPSGIVLLGDIVGNNETNVHSREQLSKFCKYLIRWNTYGPIFAVRGNHDLNGYPDFLFLDELNLIISSSKCNGYFDFYADNNSEIPATRFHIVDYKDEHRPLEICKGARNVVLGHNNYIIPGLTNWYQQHEGLEFSKFPNFEDIRLVISGHIHNPSPDFVSTTMINGNVCSLYYPGCPTRPSKDVNCYDACSVMRISYNEQSKLTDFAIIPMQLKPMEEIFYDSAMITDKTEEEIENEMRMSALKDVLGDLLKYRMNQTDPLSQIDNIPNATDKAKEIAKAYMIRALNNCGKVV